jgi:hypothetical protein
MKSCLMKSCKGVRGIAVAVMQVMTRERISIMLPWHLALGRDLSGSVTCTHCYVWLLCNHLFASAGLFILLSLALFCVHFVCCMPCKMANGLLLTPPL